MLEASFLNLSDRSEADGAVSVQPAWEVREGESATRWFEVRLAFADGARIDALAVLSEGCVSIEDVRAQPALSLADLAALSEWLEGPLRAACGIEAEPVTEAEAHDAGQADGAAETDGTGAPEDAGTRRARPAWPRGMRGRWLVAQEYRAAREEGADPVLAVMRATGHSRRRSLRLIGQARDAGFLTPRRARR